MSIITADLVVIGGGIIGLTLALEAKKRNPNSKIILIEKEKNCGSHASSRNSGVLHAGFYYTADSLKARFTLEGNKRLRTYCKDKGLKLNSCGKLVVAKNQEELKGLEELLKRGKKNGVPLEMISEKEALEIEPRAFTFQNALFSPTTASVNPGEVINSLIKDVQNSGIQIQTQTLFTGPHPQGIKTNKSIISSGYVINAAGLYADKIALDFGFSKDYRILPFKGVYLYGNPSIEKLRTNIYPVPNLDNPFLGVHFTITAEGRVKIGPTAIPAFWRENYQGWENFNFKESLEIITREAGLFLKNKFGFRRLAINEIQKYFRPKLIKLASCLVRDLDGKNYREWGKPGIRAQLFNIRKDKLEMDFQFEGDDRSFHVLNAVSPAFTCSFPFAEYLFDRIEDINLKREPRVTNGNH